MAVKKAFFFLLAMICIAGILSVYAFVFADTTSTLRPIADGGEESVDWKTKSNTKCTTTDCYLEIDESSGGSCTNSDGDTSYVKSNNNNAIQTFDIDESSIPNNATITNIAIAVCHKRDGAQNGAFQTRYCNGGSCVNSGADIAAGSSYAETIQNHAVNFTKTSGSDIEIGLVSTSNKNSRVSQISAVVTYTIPIIATASVDTSWVKGGATAKNFVFTVNNDSGSSGTIQWIKITRPSGNYTLTGGSATGWSAAASAESITFTGGSVAPGGNASFTATADIASVDEAQTAWSVTVDDDSSGGSPIGASATSPGLVSGIDSTAPSSVSVASVNANSDTQLTVSANTASDSGSGLHASPYWFDETSGNPGATDSTSWQSETSFVDAGLTASTQYCYKVKARDAVLNESVFSTEVCQTTNEAGVDNTPPAAISNLSAGSQTGSSIRLTWTAPGDDDSSGTASSYDIRYSTSPITDDNWTAATQVSGEQTPSTAGSSEAFTVGGLATSTTYHFAIKTSDEVPNVSPLSNVASETTTGEGDTTPPVISDITATNVQDSSAVIIWTTNEISTSQVEYGKSESYGSQTTLDSTFETSHSVKISGISPGTVYNYRVKSKDSAGNLAVSGNNTFFTTGTPEEKEALDIIPPVISNVKVVTTHEDATVTWFTDEPTYSFITYGETLLYEFKTDTNVNLLTGHTVTLKNLKPEIEYNFQIVDEDIKGNRTFFENQTFTTKAPPAPELPREPAPVISEVAVVAVRPASAKIAWKTDIPATSQVQFGAETKKLNQVTIEFATLTNEHVVTVSDLSPNTVYFFSVVSRNAIGERAQSKESSFQTESLEIQTVIQVARPVALPPGSPGTQIPKTAAGETVTAVPILATEGDGTAPDVVLFDFIENPTENTSPTIRGRANDRGGVIAGISYSTDGGISWHPITSVDGIGSSAARFSAKIPNLRDGNYPVLFRARDNSGNVGKSEINTLIIDIKPPTTGANVFFLGNQSLIPSAFGTISTLSNLAHKIVISAVGGATQIEVVAEKRDAENVKPAATENNTVPASEGAIDFTVTVPLARGDEIVKLQQLLVAEGVYPKELVTGYFGERTKEGIALLQKKYAPEILTPSGLTEGSGILDTATQRKIDTLLGIKKPDQIITHLSYSKQSDLWFGDVSFPEEGVYDLFVKAADGAGRVSQKPLNPFLIASPGVVTDAKTNTPISGATVSVFQFSSDINDFILWPGEIFNQANPQVTREDGSYRLILPPGKYYITAEKGGYRTFFTSILQFTNHRTVNLMLPMLPKPSIPLPFSISNISRVTFPYLPDFFGMNRVREVAEESIAPPKQVQALLGNLAPIFKSQTPTGEILDIRYLRGKKTILSVWSTWSPLAQIQIPILDELQRENEEDVAVLLLSLQESAGTIETYLRRGGYILQSISDPEGKLAELYPIFTLPQHFFIDRRGVLRDVFVGFLDKEGLTNKLEQL